MISLSTDLRFLLVCQTCAGSYRDVKTPTFAELGEVSLHG